MTYFARISSRSITGITLLALLQAFTTLANANTNRVHDVPRPTKAIDTLVVSSRFLPDLIVTQFKVTELTNDHIKWFYTVKNIGQVPVARTKVGVQAKFTIQEPPSGLYWGDGAGGTDLPPGNAIAPGGSVSSSFQAETPENYTELPYLYLIVDKDGVIEEENETNNTLQATFVTVDDRRTSAVGAATGMKNSTKGE